MAGYSERANAPTMTREVQHWIGKELRDMYAELLRQPLPEPVAIEGTSPRHRSERSTEVISRAQRNLRSDGSYSRGLPR